MDIGLYIKILELRAVKVAILTFCKGKTNLAVHLQTTLVYLMKMGVTKILVLIEETREIWELYMSQQITLTAEHPPGIKIQKQIRDAERYKNHRASGSYTKRHFRR